MRKMALTIIAAVIHLSFNNDSFALSIETHRAINLNIAKSSLNGNSLDQYLKSNLGITQGIEKTFDGRRVDVWVELGGAYEDAPLGYTIPYRRSRNHFHNPLLPLRQAGYTSWGSFCDVGHCPVSAILWARGPQYSDYYLGIDLNPGGDWSWPMTRQNYYNALTATTESARVSNFVNTFRGLGHLMHLIQDMSVPEHSRNDGHVAYAYEEWVRDSPASNDPQRQTILTNAFANPIFFDMTALSQPSVFGIDAPVPIANLFDTNQYNGTNPSETMNQNIGLSEYTNANFVSDDTLFRNFPYPSKTTSVATQDYIITDPVFPGSTVTREYYKKISDGDIGYRLAGVSYLALYLDTTDPTTPYATIPPMDDNVYGDYAKKLIPRAVGYSAGLLNYFFRGDIEILLPDNGVYAITTPSGAFKEIHLLARNVTSTGEAMTNGTIHLVVKYKLAQQDPFQSMPVPVSADFYYIVVPEKNNTSFIPQNSAAELVFDLSNNPIPLWATDVYLQVVYRGQHGNEADAVAVGFKDISEPTPIGIVNDMDRICIKGTWYAAGSPEAIAQVDSNNNGVADTNEWDVYPHNLQNIYFRFSPITNPQKATTTEYTYNNETFVSTAGSFTNVLYLLTDYEFNMSDQETVVNTNANDHYWGWGFSTEAFPVDGVMRQDVLRPSSECDVLHIVPNNPCYIQVPPSFITHRGWTIWNAFLYENEPYPADAICPEE